MDAANQVMAFIVVGFGLLVGLVGIMPPLADIGVIIFKYLRKLFAGPIKTEPFTPTSSSTVRKSEYDSK